MRSLGILLAILLWPCLARAIKPASTTEKIAVQDLIDQANEINKTSSSNPKVRDIEKLQQDLARENSQPENLKNRGLIAHLQVELKALKKQRDNLYLQAIRKTLIAYDLVDLDSNGLPSMPSKSAVHPLVKGRDVHWIVIFKDDEPRTLLDNRREAQIVPAGNKKAGGMTGADGVTTMYGKFHSPADLALLLYHEKVHYEQFTTKGVGDILNYDEREEQAFMAQHQILGKVGLTPAERKLFDFFLAGDGTSSNPGKIREHRDKGRAERLRTKGKLGFWGRGEPPSIKPRTRGEYAAILEQTKDFESELAAEARAMADARAQQVAIAHRDHDERVQRQWTALARRACDTPSSVSQSELDALPRLHNKEPLDVVMLFGNCYERVYYRLHAGESAEAIAREARPAGAAEPPRPLPPVAEAVAERTFGSVFPDLQFFAEMACKYGGHLPTPASGIFDPRGGYALKYGDDEAAARIAAGLGRCEGHVFRRLFAMLREGRGNQITDQWFIDTVSRTPAAPSSPPPGGGQVSPPTGGYVAPPKGTNPCQVGDDPFACQGKHPKL